jgi:hypothetical protein
MIEFIRVEVTNISVGRRFFSFDYRVHRNKKLLTTDGHCVNDQWDHYDSSHSRSHTTMRKLLKSGYATELVLQRLF